LVFVKTKPRGLRPRHMQSPAVDFVFSILLFILSIFEVGW